MRALTLRLFGATAFVAVGSYWAQLGGLAGRQGIAPAVERLLGAQAAGVGFFELPTLLWLSSSDVMLHALCAVASMAAVLLIAGVVPRPALAALWVAWLSLVTVGAPFLSFQWDVLLLEACAVLFVYAPAGLRSTEGPSRAGLWLVAFLSFKVTFASGLVKVLSGDPAWRDLSALTYHWWSQPLPTWSSVWASLLPMGVQKVLCALVFVFELPVPLLALGPPRVRRWAGAGVIALQAGLFVAGNYSYYNVLTAVLALPLLEKGEVKPSRAWQWVMLGLVVMVSVIGFWQRMAEPPKVLASLVRLAAPFSTINNYGAFAVMTKERVEIVFEGSDEAQTSWQPYELPHQPGDVTRRPGFVAPWQPRLDWQMWFASLGSCQHNIWVLQLQQRLLQGTPEVLRLFSKAPTQAPKVMRSVRYRYRFAPWSERGVWWQRERLADEYCPRVMLDSRGELIRVP